MGDTSADSETVHLLSDQTPEPTEEEDSNSTRIVVLGKTGAGKSSACNTIFGEPVFMINHTANAGTSKCAAVNRSVDGKSITLIDTPGFFDPDRSKEELKDEIVTCITECAPGPHVFIILLKVEKFTPHEKQVIDEILNTFSEKAFKYAVVVFTHGDQLPEGMKIEEFVKQNKGLSNLVEKCGGRYHVIDNKYWKNKQQDEYRSNQFQVEQILNTIDTMVEENKGGYYTNEMLQEVHTMIKEHGKSEVSKILKIAAGITAGALLGGLVGAPVVVLSTIIMAMTTAAAGSVAGAIAGGVVGGYLANRDEQKNKKQE